MPSLALNSLSLSKIIIGFDATAVVKSCLISLKRASGRMRIPGGWFSRTGLFGMGSLRLIYLSGYGFWARLCLLRVDQLYAQYTINERSDGLVCMSINGQIKWKTGENPLFNKGGSVLVHGLLLSTYGSTMLYDRT